MSTSRRDFLTNSGLAIMAGAAGYMSTDHWLRGADLTTVGQPMNGTAHEDDRIRPTIVTIFLRGGADALNAIVPYGDENYYSLRPNISIPERPKKDKAVLKLSKKIGGGYWGINPYMESLLPMVEEGKCALLMNTGSPNGTRSHFSAQDYMERGAPGDPRVTNGWLNRYLEATKKQTDAPLRGLCAMTLLPRALRGEYPVLAGSNRSEEMDLFEDLYASSNLANQTARDGAMGEKGSRLDDRPGDETRKRQLTSDWARDLISQSGTNAVARIKALEAAEAKASAAEYPNGGLGHQLRTIAQVIKANVGLEVAQADYGGWDHHSDEGEAGGKHSKMLQNLSESIVAFTKDLGPRMDRVMVLVMSEFGRTAKENGARGTDHGRGGMMIAVGNMVAAPHVLAGTSNGMADLEDGRFQPVHIDYRSVFAESLARLYSIDPFKLGLFPNWKPTNKDYVGFMNQVKLT